MMRKRQCLAGCRVLVVEDEFFIAADLERALLAYGAEVVGPIGSLTEAMRQIAKDGFEVVVLDINLRNEMTYSLADELRRQNVPFVFATGYALSSLPERFRDAMRWEKPYDAHALIRDIERLCPKTPRLAMA